MVRTIITPSTQTVSFKVPKNYVGQEMEVIAFTKKEGFQQTENTEPLLPSLQGSPLTNSEFLNWIRQAETLNTISLQEAKSQWANKRKQLQRLIK